MDALLGLLDRPACLEALLFCCCPFSTRDAPSRVKLGRIATLITVMHFNHRCNKNVQKEFKNVKNVKKRDVNENNFVNIE